MTVEKGGAVNRVDVFLQYYKPHVSGLTNMAAVLAEHAAASGYDVHVHCVASSGPGSDSVVNGVTVHAYRRSFSLGRGMFSFQLLRAMWRMRRRGGLAHLHLPYPESFVAARLFSRSWRFIVTYQCDAPMTGGMGSVIAHVLDWSHRQLLRRTTVTAFSSDDYAEHSRLRDAAPTERATAIPVTGHDRAGGSPVYAVPGRRLIGFLGRPTAEKGIDVLVAAMKSFPRDDVAVLFAGPVTGLSERAGYDAARLQSLIDDGRVIPIGFLEEHQIADFYASLDLYAFPSVNSFEAFGIVQIEAMSAGVPVVASNLPGVRTVVQATGFGEVTAIGDVADLTRGLLTALDATYDPAYVRRVLEEHYLPPRPQDAYLRLYERVLAEPPR